MHGHLSLIKASAKTMDFEEFKYQVIQIILTECPGRSSVSVNNLIENNIESFCNNYFNGSSIEVTAKNILYSQFLNVRNNEPLH